MNAFVIKTIEGVTVSDELFQALAIMSKSRNQLKIVRNEQNQMTMNGVVIEPQGGDNLKIGNKTYEVTTKIQNALTKTNF